MSTYMPTPDHGLSDDSQALSADRLENEALQAEYLLGLVGTAFTDSDAQVARGAVAIQINWQLVRAAHVGMKSEGRGRQSVTYDTSPVSPEALERVRGLLGPPAQSTASEADFRW